MMSLNLSKGKRIYFLLNKKKSSNRIFRSISGTPKLIASDSVDSDETHRRHSSILNRAMIGVRNFLAVCLYSFC